ncbi:protein kinase domain-containing protein [Pseudobutyrivibrio sp.]|uniref:protein kinase domain-containing protein n=1 Tax=Pseudobutyrivibrio sp. TaxID=2014367 RepID=UPI00386767CC
MGEPSFKDYKVLKVLGRGAYATVYKVRHNELDYIRAIKVLNKLIIGEDDPIYIKFLNECKTLLKLGNGCNPSIVHIYKPLLLNGFALVEMDYVDGENISEYLKRENCFIPLSEIYNMAIQISSALAYCHKDSGLNVLHNDIHYGNIMRRRNGSYTLLDFGLSINKNENEVSSSRRNAGAWEFLPPEKWDLNSEVNEQSDIYSFGILLYQCLAGRVPFPYDKTNPNEAQARFNLSNAHKYTPPPNIESLRKEAYEKKFEGKTYTKDYPDWLEKTILKCLEKDPKERFKNGKELYDHIEELTRINPSIDEAKVKNLEKDNTELRETIKETQDKNCELQIQNDELKNQANKLNDQLRNLKLHITDLENEINNILRPRIGFLTLFLLAFGMWGAISTYYWYQGSQVKIITSPSDSVSFIESESLKNQLAQKDKEIQNLQATSRQDQQTIKTLQERIAKSGSNTATIAELNNQIKQKNTQIQNLQATSRQDQQTIKTLKDNLAKLESSTATIAELNNQIKQKNTQIQNLQATSKQDQQTIKTLKENQVAIESNTTNTIELTKKITQKDNQIKELNKKLDDANIEITSLQKCCFKTK